MWKVELAQIGANEILVEPCCPLWFCSVIISAMMKLWWIIINVLIWIRFFAGSLPQNHRKKWIPGSSMGEIHNNGWWIWTKTNVKSVAALNVVNIVYGLGKVSSQNFGVTGVLFCGVVSSYLLLSLCKCKSSFGAKSLFNQIFRNQSFLLWNWMAGFHLAFVYDLALLLLSSCYKNLTL